MKILTLADVECKALWDYYTPGKLKDYDLILSCGDLKPAYLSFLVTMGKAPLFYVHGNHDDRYRETPPDGCECIEDRLMSSTWSRKRSKRKPRSIRLRGFDLLFIPRGDWASPAGR